MSGVVVLIVALALLVVQASRAFSRQMARGIASAGARLTAASGMEYAAARLLAESEPVAVRSAANRGDDWACRDGLGPQSSSLGTCLNPSYSHGETYDDSGGVLAGVYERGADGFWESQDLDGDGRLGAWSGRLRGGRSLLGGAFVLRVESADGKIPINAGLLSGASASSLSIPYHQGLAHALNNLGVTCGVTARRETVPSGDLAGVPGEPIETCWIGFDLISARPAGGYRSWEQAEERMLALAVLGGPYTKEDLAKMRPFIDLGPYERPATARMASTAGYTPISFSTAPREVLRSLWMYLNAPRPDGLDLEGERVDGPDADTLPDRPSLTLVPYTRTGPASTAATRRFLRVDSAVGNLPYAAFPMIYPDEADRIVQSAEALRASGTATWRTLRERLVADAPWLFERDYADLAAVPAWRRLWIQAKADLAFQAAAIDPYPYGPAPRGRPNDVAATLAGWGIDRWPDDAAEPATLGIQQASYVHLNDIARVPYPSSFGAGWPTGSFTPRTFTPYLSQSGSGSFDPQGLTMAPPCSFEVESLARPPGLPASGEAVAKARVRALERLELSTQEDFENWRAGAPLLSRGILVDDPSPETRRELRADGDRSYPHVSTLPVPPLRGFHPEGDPAAAYSLDHGAVGLASREGGLSGACLYWPFSEDFDHTPDTAWPFGYGFLSEQGAGYGYGPYRYPAVFVFGNSTPYAYGGNSYVASFQMPGLHASTNGELIGMTAEAWMGPNSRIRLTVPASGTDAMHIFSTRVPVTGGIFPVEPNQPAIAGVSGTYYTVNLYWREGPTATSPGGVCFNTHAYFIADRSTEASRFPWTHHVVVTFERIHVTTAGICAGHGTTHPRTRVRLYVDGATAADAYFGVGGDPFSTPAWTWTAGPVGMEFIHWQGAVNNPNDGTMLMSDSERLELTQVDELRFYDGVVSEDPAVMAGWARDRYLLERFTRHGRFLSPTYVVPERTRLRKCQWLGLVPPASFEADNLTDPARSAPAVGPDGKPIPVDPFAVGVEAFDETGSLLPPSPFPVGANGTASDFPLEWGDRVRSFRYMVEFDCKKVAGVLNDTPVFESIWFTHRRRGPVPWSRWAWR